MHSYNCSVVTQNTSGPLVSIIIPAYNEERRLPATLAALDEFAQNPAHAHITLEAIVVDNASSDGTNAIASAFAAAHPYVRVIREMTRGKGAAVKAGIFEGRGEYLFMCDADLSMPMSELPKFFSPKLDGYDVAIGTREGPGANRFDEPSSRHLQGRVGTLLTKIMVGLPYEDTQCGYKSIRREPARKIFEKQTLNGWGFDIEILFIARRMGYKIAEVPIDWYYRAESRVRPGIDALKTLRELWHVRQNARKGMYG